jgi:hypothetical protein
MAQMQGVPQRSDLQGPGRPSYIANLKGWLDAVSSRVTGGRQGQPATFQPGIVSARRDLK